VSKPYRNYPVVFHHTAVSAMRQIIPLHPGSAPGVSSTSHPRSSCRELGAACRRPCGPRHGMSLSNHHNGGVSCTYLNADRNSAHPSSMIKSEIAWRHSTPRIKGADRGRLQIIESAYGLPAF